MHARNAEVATNVCSEVGYFPSKLNTAILLMKTMNTINNSKNTVPLMIPSFLLYIVMKSQRDIRYDDNTYFINSKNDYL
jgi:hypothetical protein